MKRHGFLAGVATVALLAGCSWLGFPSLPVALDMPAATPAATGDAGKGQAAYAARCQSCHGADGKGVGVDVRKQSFDALKAKMTGSMSAYMSGMTDADVRDLEAYLLGL